MRVERDGLVMFVADSLSKGVPAFFCRHETHVLRESQQGISFFQCSPVRQRHCCLTGNLCPFLCVFGLRP